jgi:enoyl-CoA hydratase/carnithine racemase
VFAIKEVVVGLAADVGSLQRLPKKTGNDSLLRELALTGRDFSAEEALTLGLVNKVAEDVKSEVEKLAKAISGKFYRKVLASIQIKWIGFKQNRTFSGRSPKHKTPPQSFPES